MTAHPAQAPRDRRTHERPPDPVIVVSHLAKRYGATRAMVDVSFDVHAGEIFGLLGPNCAGTTTVESVQGLRLPDSGDVRVLGLDPRTDVERLRPLMGSQLQESALPNRSSSTR